MVVVSRCCCKWRGRIEGAVALMQAVRLLHEEVASQSEGACGDMLVLPIYAALPPELQVMHPPLQSTLCSSRLEKSWDKCVACLWTRMMLSIAYLNSVCNFAAACLVSALSHTKRW